MVHPEVRTHSVKTFSTVRAALVMEDAAVHRMAVALSHHTVCQVTIEELQVAADLIRKTSRQMQVISNAPSLFVENLECAKHHLHLLLQELSLL